MKHYKLLKEYDSHFDLEHDKQGTFVVAKYGLDDATIKKIRSLGGVARYAEGTEDAEGVKVEDAPGLMLAPQDQGVKARDYLLTPYEQFQAPDVQVPLAPEDDLALAQRMREMELANSDEALAQRIARSDSFQEEDLPVPQKTVTAPRGKSAKEGFYLQDNLYDEEPVRTSPEPEDESVTSYSPAQPMTIYGKTPKEEKAAKKDEESIFDKVKSQVSDFVNKAIDKSDFLKEGAAREQEFVDKYGRKPTEPDTVLEGLNNLKQKFTNFLDEQTKQVQETFGGAPKPGQPLSPGEAARYGLPAGSTMPVPTAAPAPAAEPAPQIVAPAQKSATPAYLQQTQRALTPVPRAQPTQTEMVGSGQPQDPLQMASQAYDDMKRINLSIAESEQEKADRVAIAQLASIKRLENLEQNYNRQLKALNDEGNQLQNDIMTTKIDPFRIYSRMSTGNRVLAAVSLLIGGVSQGLLRSQTNPAWDVIQDALNRDIDAQKTELGRKQTLLSFNLQKYGRLDAATAATRAQLLNIVQAQINLAATKANSDIAMKNAELTNAQIDLEKAKLYDSLAKTTVTDDVLNTQTGIDPSMVMALPEKTRKLLVRVPNGQYYPAKDEDLAKKANDIILGLNSVEAVLNRSENILRGSSFKSPTSKEIGLAESTQNQLLLEIKNLAMLGVLNEGDKAIIDPMLPDLKTMLNKGPEFGRIEALRSYLIDRINAALKQAVPNYSPDTIKATVVQ